jgi:hypothetical protein
MDAHYFRERWCVAFARLGRNILRDLGTYSEDVTSALDSLEFGLSSADPLITATHELVGEFISDMVSNIVGECMLNPKTKRRRERTTVDLSNVRIRRGYPYDMFVLCGGLD